MYDYDFDTDEKLILENDGVIWASQEMQIDYLVLTNKKLYCMYENYDKRSKKTSMAVDELPLSDIVTIKGRPIINQKRYEGDLCLQIQFRKGMEYFHFFDSPQQITPIWVSAISEAVEKAFTEENTKEKADSIKMNAKDVPSAGNDGKYEFVEKFQISTGEDLKRHEDVATVASESSPSIGSVKSLKVDDKAYTFCIKCGTKLPPGIRFCHVCGQRVGEREESSDASNWTKIDKSKKKDEQRHQEYVGKIYKCPYCGESIDSFVTICPTCGHELRGASNSDSVREFAEKIDSAQNDMQRVRIIRNYPVPNTKEDIFEFMILASTNIKGEQEKSVFDAWLVKYEQCYQKALLVIKDPSDIAQINGIYEKTHKQIGKEKLLRNAKAAGNTISKSSSNLRTIILILVKSAPVIAGIVLFIIAINIDSNGGNSSGHELLGVILLIVSASILNKRGASLVEILIVAISGGLSIFLARFLDNGSALQLGGGIVLIITAVCFFKKLLKKEERRGE